MSPERAGDRTEIAEAWLRRAYATGEVGRVTALRFALAIHVLADSLSQDDWHRWLNEDQRLVDEFRADGLGD